MRAGIKRKTGIKCELEKRESPREVGPRTDCAQRSCANMLRLDPPPPQLSPVPLPTLRPPPPPAFLPPRQCPAGHTGLRTPRYRVFMCTWFKLAPVTLREGAVGDRGTAQPAEAPRKRRFHGVSDQEQGRVENNVPGSGRGVRGAGE